MCCTMELCVTVVAEVAPDPAPSTGKSRRGWSFKLKSFKIGKKKKKDRGSIHEGGTEKWKGVGPQGDTACQQLEWIGF